MNCKVQHVHAWVMICFILLFCFPMADAQSNSSNLVVQYDKALDILSSISLSDNEALEAVCEMLDSASGYSHASKYKYIVETLMVLNDVDQTDFHLRAHEIWLYISMLTEDESFMKDYAEHEVLSELLPLGRLITYIDGRKAEYNGETGEASSLYKECKILDSIERYVKIGKLAAAETNPIQNPWTDEQFTLYALQSAGKGDKRVQAYCGPANTYHGAGAYKTNKMSRIQGIFTEGGYILVDMDYATVGKRRVYFKTSAFTGSDNVPQAIFKGYDAITTVDVTPRFGPGDDYDGFSEADVSAGLHVLVLFEEKGYVFAEFDSTLGIVREWIDVTCIQAQ